MGGHHHHHSDNIRSLTLAACLTGAFLIAEVIGGILTQSLALLSDAAHMMTDVAALLIAIMAIKIGKKPADDMRTYGYRRIEILAAALNAFILFLVAGYILYEAYERFVDPVKVQSPLMMAIAVIGLVVNLICMRILAAGSAHSLNMKGAYLEVMADMVGSIAVIAAGAIIYFTGWQQIDPILAVLIGLWVFPRTWKLFSESINILLEGVPQGVELHTIVAELAALETVTGVHDVHVWAITSGQNSMTAHLQVTQLPKDDTLLESARTIAKRHQIAHTNFQIEVSACHTNEHDHHHNNHEHTHHE